MIDVIGDLATADVLTNTGTIHADVPTEALKVRFEWESSRPRFLSDIELPRVKEGRGGVFSIAGTLGAQAKQKKEKKPKENDKAASAADPATTGAPDKGADAIENGSDG